MIDHTIVMLTSMWATPALTSCNKVPFLDNTGTEKETNYFQVGTYHG